MAVWTFTNLSEVPDDLKEQVKEENGTFKVNVVAKNNLDSFRENNIKLSQERDSLIGKISRYEQVTGVPLEEADAKLDVFAKEFEALRTTKKRVDDGALVENTSLDEAAAARVTEVTNGFKQQLAESAKEREAWRAKAQAAEESRNKILVENTIRVAASDPEVAMLDKAVYLLLPQALSVFRVDDNNKVTPRDASGAILYGSDGINPMTAKEWLLKQREESSFLFLGSKGGGAAGSSEKTIGGKYTPQQLAAMPRAERMNAARSLAK